MRWVKHLSTAHDDSEVDRLLEECGAEGYGAYWLIIEDIAGPMEAGKMTPEATHSDRKWAQLTHTNHLTWKSLKKKMAGKLLLITESEDGRVTISAPNILKYKDEYSKKSRHTPDLIRYRADTDTEAEADADSAGGASPKPAAPKPTPAAALDPSQSSLERDTAAAVSRMQDKHPYPSNGFDALYAFQRLVQTAVNPQAVLVSSEKNHAAWCEDWARQTAENGRTPWVPKLADFFRDGYHAKLPPVRDGPMPIKSISKSKQERESDAAREQFAKLSKEKANEPRIHGNR